MLLLTTSSLLVNGEENSSTVGWPNFCKWTFSVLQLFSVDGRSLPARQALGIHLQSSMLTQNRKLFNWKLFYIKCELRSAGTWKSLQLGMMETSSDSVISKVHSLDLSPSPLTELQRFRADHKTWNSALPCISCILILRIRDIMQMHSR